MSLLGNNIKRAFAVTCCFFALALFAHPAQAAQKIELLNGETKLGEISMRTKGSLQEMAIDEIFSALKLDVASDDNSIVASSNGKKMEFWKDANIARAASELISMPTAVVVQDGHWWGEGRVIITALSRFCDAIGAQSDFRWGAASATAEPEPALKKQPKAEPKPESAEIKATPQQMFPIPPLDEPEPMPPMPRKSSERPIVVVDAGHGGHDPGAVANKTQEKDINLKAALQLAEVLKEKGIDARLTRSTDVYLKLAERTEFANSSNADVFISMHCNSMPKGRSDVAGFEIYIMALPSDKDAMNLAITENRELTGGAQSAADIEQADKRTQILLKILGDMHQNEKIEESTALTEVLHDNAKKSGLPMRKVAQAPFFVLRGAAMPAVLVEMGYLTNAAEAQKLNSAAYREQICRSLAEGIISFIGTAGHN